MNCVRELLVQVTSPERPVRLSVTTSLNRPQGQLIWFMQKKVIQQFLLNRTMLSLTVSGTLFPILRLLERTHYRRSISVGTMLARTPIPHFK